MKPRKKTNPLKCDRHGRIVDGEIANAEDFLRWGLSGVLSEMDRIAHQVFVDRNARGYPEIYRAAAKAKARPALRRALGHAALARTALLSDDKHKFDVERLHAHLELANAAADFRQAYINTYRLRQKDRVPGRRNKFESDGDDEHVNVSEIIKSLAAKMDVLGDYIPSMDIWPELYSRLDEMGLDPDEQTDREGRPLACSYDGGSIQFSSFKAMVSKARRKLT